MSYVSFRTGETYASWLQNNIEKVVSTPHSAPPIRISRSFASIPRCTTCEEVGYELGLVVI